MRPASLHTQPVDLEGFRAEMREAALEGVVSPTLDAYRREAVSHRDRLEKAVAAGDLAEITDAAHTMKSAAWRIKAVFLAQILLEMEAAGMRESVATARVLMGPLRDEYEAVQGFLDQAATKNYRN